MNKARMISFVVTLSVLVASSSGFARGLRLLPWKGQQLVRVLGHPWRVRSGVRRAPDAAGPCRAALLLSGFTMTGSSRGPTCRLGSWAASSPSWLR